ncbi:MAG TPA: hypothetical protein VGF07_13175 [Stellaceae bacterium]|jgi:hypothetical protein
MPRERLTFRQRDITAAIKAVERAGHTVARVSISPDGNIVAELAPSLVPLDAAEPEANPWDDLYEDENSLPAPRAGSAYAAALKATASRSPKPPRRSTHSAPMNPGSGNVVGLARKS